jgi:hypothetical protein
MDTKTGPQLRTSEPNGGLSGLRAGLALPGAGVSSSSGLATRETRTSPERDPGPAATFFEFSFDRVRPGLGFWDRTAEDDAGRLQKGPADQLIQPRPRPARPSPTTPPGYLAVAGPKLARSRPGGYGGLAESLPAPGKPGKRLTGERGPESAEAILDLPEELRAVVVLTTPAWAMRRSHDDRHSRGYPQAPLLCFEPAGSGAQGCRRDQVPGHGVSRANGDAGTENSNGCRAKR